MGDVSNIEDALILFADVIDSSKHSSVLGMVAYAEELHKFQTLFKSLGDKYFSSPSDKTNNYCDVRARGDEGIVFCINHKKKGSGLIYDAVKFAYELKARMEILRHTDELKGPVPQPMKIGVGIHYGKVATMTRIEKIGGRNRSVISKLEGYSINYAKRIESCSRLGQFSQVFLSKDAVPLLSDAPIAFKKHSAPLKGIKNEEEIFEVRSAFFESFPSELEEQNTEDFFKIYCEEADKLDMVNEPWLKGLVASVIDSRLKKAHEAGVSSLIKSYSNKLNQIAWQKPIDDDPIIMFIRSNQCRKEGKKTQRLTYLRQLVEKYPHFVHARTKLVEACWDVANDDPEKAELVLARDVADEFLNRFPEYLTNDEKKTFEAIIRETSRK